MSRFDTELYAEQFDLDGQSLWLAATAQGLCFVGSQEAWNAWRKNDDYVQGKDKLRSYAEQLEQYFRGERSEFSLPVDMRGTPFQQSVWKALTEIPFGSRVSYTDIAAHIGKSESVRAVAAAIGANPVLIVVPCHRVVGKNGSLTGFREGLDMKQRLLELESPSAIGLKA